MAIKSSGPLRLADLVAEFGGPSNPARLSNYYKGGLYVSASAAAPNVPTYGPIKLSNFYGAVNVVIGQIDYTTAGAYTFIVPAGVTSVCAICVGNGEGITSYSSSYPYYESSVTVGGVKVCSAGSGDLPRVGDGGGGGGILSGIIYGYPGGCGAGGYSGAGGGPGLPGSGGGGGGGAGGDVGYPGGGVGLLGQGASGMQGVNQPGRQAGVPGSGGSGRLYGGGAPGKAGGALAYKNAIAVTPGQAVSIVVSYGGAVRLIWGAGRAYPSTNTGNL